MNALRLLFGTLTILPVRPPARVDRRTTGWALALAPLAGLVLAVPLVLVVVLVQETAVSVSALLLSFGLVGALAVLTRAVHLDGLADTADGLGSGRRGPAALEVMRRSDIGPFGVVTLVLLLGVQVSALAQCLAAGSGPAALVVALVVSRAVLAPLGTEAFPAARADGLGAPFAGSVSVGQLVAAVALTVLSVAGALLLLVGLGATDGEAAGRLAATCLVAVLPGLALAVHARRRFGGVTGDVYGAVVETTFTAALVTAALVS